MASTLTNKAKVESNPPDKPITNVLAWVCSTLFTKPITCNFNIHIAL